MESRGCELVGLEYCGRDGNAAASITRKWELADRSQLGGLTLLRFLSAGLVYINPGTCNDGQATIRQELLFTKLYTPFSSQYQMVGVIFSETRFLVPFLANHIVTQR